MNLVMGTEHAYLALQYLISYSSCIFVYVCILHMKLLSVEDAYWKFSVL
jgi:hypothetical protein